MATLDIQAMTAHLALAGAILSSTELPNLHNASRAVREKVSSIKHFEDAAAGGIAGALGHLIGGTGQMTFSSAVQRLVQAQPESLSRGIPPNVLHSTMHHATRFGMYTYLAESQQKAPWVAATLSSGLAALAASPFVMLGAKRAHSMLRSGVAQSLRVAGGASVSMTAYQMMKLSSSDPTNLGVQAMAGLMSGLITAMAITPVDAFGAAVSRARGSARGVWNEVQAQGMRKMYGGLGTNMLHMGSQCAVTFVLFEQIRCLLHQPELVPQLVFSLDNAPRMEPTVAAIAVKPMKDSEARSTRKMEITYVDEVQALEKKLEAALEKSRRDRMQLAALCEKLDSCEAMVDSKLSGSK